MAHKKAGGSTSLGRDSIAKRLGIKKFDGEIVKPGVVIVRQRGTKIHPGINVERGGDDTLFSMAEGTVKFVNRKRTRFDGTKKMTKFVNVVKAEKK